jgi:LPXTG-site transpeptidase (sortase) family protein
MKSNIHRRLNNVLTIVVVILALYVVVFPYIPEIRWRLSKRKPIAPYVGVLAKEVTAVATKPIPQDNRIVLPSAQVDLPILEGSGVWVIDNGGSLRKNLWTESPKDDGNTVIIGHRFSYAKPTGGFYYLEKVQVGDKLAIYWQGEELLYVVVETKTVPNTAIEIENNTPDRTLTLYTCTPVFTAENRLVVTAKPYKVEVNK